MNKKFWLYLQSLKIKIFSLFDHNRMVVIFHINCITHSILHWHPKPNNIGKHTDVNYEPPCTY